MSAYELLDDLYAYNDWANAKVLQLCEGLSDRELDHSREIGFGSLRAVLFHILTAERVWMERWTGAPWRPFPFDPEGTSLDEIRGGLREVAAQRRSLIELHRADRWDEEITFQDSKKSEYTRVLFNLLVHVANHGVHHRAQALHYLKQYDRKLPAGLDYAFYRLAASSVPQAPESIKGLTDFGLEVAVIESPDPSYDPLLIKRLYRYHDWAVQETLAMCDTVDVAALDRNFEMGSGSIRKTLLHLMDAEEWWINNWTGEAGAFPRSAEDMSLQAIRDHWSGLAKQRNAFLANVDADESMRVVIVHPGGPPTAFRVGESILHLGLHGTHHRAQIINMVRRSEGRVRDIDFLYAIL